MSKHTPGPWFIEVVHETEQAYTIVHGTNRHGDGPAGVVGKVFAKNEADARLIAAAPDLLKALQTIIGDSAHGQNMSWTERCSQARAAIAKATGEQA